MPQLRINWCKERELLTVPGVGKKVASNIVAYRATYGNITADNIEEIPRLRFSEALYQSIDFTQNPHLPERESLQEEDDRGSGKDFGKLASDPGLGQQKSANQAQRTEASIREVLRLIESRQGALLPESYRQRSLPRQEEGDSDEEWYPSYKPKRKMEAGYQGRTRSRGHVSEESEDDLASTSRQSHPSKHRGAGRRRQSRLGYGEEEEGRFHERTSRASRGRPPVLPKHLEFDGRSNWSLFKQKFVRYAEAAGWTPEERRDALCWGLTGKAGDYYHLLSEMNVTLSYRKIISEFDKRFQVTELQETLQAKFQVACQESDENLQDWADRVLGLAVKAYKDLPETWVRKHAIMRFCLGCREREAGKHACMQKHQTLEAAIEEIEWYRCIHQSSEARKKPRSDVLPVYRTQYQEDSSESEVEDFDVRRVRRVGGPSQNDRGASSQKAPVSSILKKTNSPTVEQRVTSLEGGVSSLQSQLSQLTLKIEAQNTEIGTKFDVLLAQLKTTQNRSRSPSPRHSNCYKCNQPGHFIRDCPTAKKEVTFKAAALNISGLGKQDDSSAQVTQ